MKKIFKRELLPNKVVATILVLVNYIGMRLDGTNDGTAFVMCLFIALFIFFARVNLINN